MQDVSAMTLKVNPPEFRTTLKQGEKQKGFVDVTNPYGGRVKVKTSVKAFRQADNEGNLAFYDDEQVTAGIQPDLITFELGSQQTMRMYFLVDGAKLPAGNVFAAIFFSASEGAADRGISQSVALGTLLSIVNGASTANKAEVTSIKANWLQVGDGVDGIYSVKNKSDVTKNTGFYPEVIITLTPFTNSMTKTSSLVFPDRERSNDFSFTTSRIGFYKLRVSYGDSSKEQWVFLVTGWWRAIVPLLLVVLTLGLFSYFRRQKRRQKSTTKNTL